MIKYCGATDQLAADISKTCLMYGRVFNQTLIAFLGNCSQIWYTFYVNNNIYSS